MAWKKRNINGNTFYIENDQKVSLSASEWIKAQKRWRKQVAGLIADQS